MLDTICLEYKAKVNFLGLTINYKYIKAKEGNTHRGLVKLLIVWNE